MIIRYPPEPEPGQDRVTWERESLNPWRNEIKRQLLAVRGWKCERCSATGTLDLDEGIVPRSSMRGLSLEQRRIAFGLPNLFILCSRCNREEAHDPAWSFEQSCRHWGEAAVREWYAAIGFKAPEARFMP